MCMRTGGVVRASFSHFFISSPSSSSIFACVRRCCAQLVSQNWFHEDVGDVGKNEKTADGEHTEEKNTSCPGQRGCLRKPHSSLTSLLFLLLLLLVLFLLFVLFLLVLFLLVVLLLLLLLVVVLPPVSFSVFVCTSFVMSLYLVSVYSCSSS